MFLENGESFGLPEYPLGNARKLLCGVDKGVRFIEGPKFGDVVPALVLDCKLFKAILSFFFICLFQELHVLFIDSMCVGLYVYVFSCQRT